MNVIATTCFQHVSQWQKEKTQYTQRITHKEIFNTRNSHLSTTVRNASFMSLRGTKWRGGLIQFYPHSLSLYPQYSILYLVNICGIYCNLCSKSEMLSMFWLNFKLPLSWRYLRYGSILMRAIVYVIATTCFQHVSQWQREKAIRITHNEIASTRNYPAFCHCEERVTWQSHPIPPTVFRFHPYHFILYLIVNKVHTVIYVLNKKYYPCVGKL